MLPGIHDAIKDEVLLQNNKKVKEENLDEFLKDFKNDELTRFAIVHVFVNQDYKDLLKIRNLNNRPKKYIIEYIIKNLDTILKCFIKVLDKSNLKVLSQIVSRIKEKKYDMSDLDISFFIVMFLKKFALAKVEFNKKANELKIYMPSEYIEIISKYLEDKNLMKENKYYSDTISYVISLLEVYGMIPLTELHKLYGQQIGKIDIDELHHIIECKSMIEESLCVHIFDEPIICNLEFFDEDEAYEFYLEQTGEYKEFNKKELEKISNRTFVESLKSYKNFINYLTNNFEGIKEDIDEIKEFIVYDYLISAQLDLDVANKNFEHNVSLMFEVSNIEIVTMKSLLEKIYKEYPKWKKRGNI